MTSIAPVGQAAAAAAWQSQPSSSSSPGRAAEANSVSVSATRRIEPPAGTRIILSIEAAETAGASDAFMIWRARGMADAVVIDAAPGESVAYQTRVLAMQMQGSGPIRAAAEEPVPDRQTPAGDKQAEGVEAQGGRLFPTPGVPAAVAGGTETAYRSAGRIMAPPTPGAGLKQVYD